MRAYTVHIKDGQDETAVLVADAFSWSAFFLTVLWALWHRMWLAASALFVLFAVTGFLADEFGLGVAEQFVLHTAFSLVLGLGAGELRRTWLSRRGWRETDQVEARNKAEAEIRFLATPGGTS